MLDQEAEGGKAKFLVPLNGGLDEAGGFNGYVCCGVDELYLNNRLRTRDEHGRLFV